MEMENYRKHFQYHKRATSDNTAYTLRADALAFRDIAPFGRNVVYAGDVK